MLEMLMTYWWLVAIGLAAGAYLLLRVVAERMRGAFVEKVLSNAQAGFAKGDVLVHSVEAVREIIVDDETGIEYAIDATITPSNNEVSWCAADLFLRGASDDPNQIGDVLRVQRWDGEKFVPAKNRATYEGSQRLRLAMRFAGEPCGVNFQWNCGRFGPEIQLPPLEVTQLH